MDDTQRLDAARRLLQEAVFASRGAGVGAGLTPGTGDGPGGCGLGAGPDLDVRVLGAGASATARECASVLWPRGLDEERTASARRTIAAWVKRQDGLDRRRNHFIKDFRAEHGAERARYAPDVLAAYEAGLETVNAENRARLEEAARALAEV